MKILDLYKALLKTANMVVSEDGFVSRQFGDKTEPALIKGKRLVLPTQEHMRNPKPEEQVMFHPLSENILRGPSLVLADFRLALVAKLQVIIGTLSFQLLQLGTSVAEHSKLTPEQSEFLSSVKNADEKTLEVFGKILSNMSASQHSNVFISLYLKRGGVVNDKKYSRAGIVSFPFYEELLKDEAVYGVTLRKKDRETFIGLMEYLFPSIETIGHYSRGSDSDTAPSLDALMKVIMAVASPINDQVNLFSNIIDEPEQLVIEDSWVDTFDNLAVMIPEIRLIPMQAGNEGEISTDSTTPPPSAMGYTAPIIPPNPVPMYPPAAPPGYNQQYPTAPPAPIKNADGTVNFDSILRANPALGGLAVNPQMLYTNERPPRWSNVGDPMYGNPPLGYNQQYPQQQQYTVAPMYPPSNVHRPIGL